MKKETLKSIAEHFNVSTATISKALNNRPDISEQLKREIVEYVEAVKYKPDYFARRLKGGRTNVIGVVIADLNNPIYGFILSGISDVVDVADFNLMLCNSKEDEDCEARHIEMLLQRSVDGLLVIPASSKEKRRKTPRFETLVNSGVPYVFLNRYVEGCKADIVMTDNRLIARQATRYLIEKGHRDILHFTSNLSNSTVHDRLEGFREELACSGLPFSKENVFCSDIDQEKCYENTVKLFGTSPRPPFTAIYTYNDLMAFPVIRALTDSGLRVPQDVAVIGNDNISFCEDCLVPLTTIAQDNYEIGKSAAALLIEKLSGGSGTIRTLLLKPSGIVERKSV